MEKGQSPNIMTTGQKVTPLLYKCLFCDIDSNDIDAHIAHMVILHAPIKIKINRPEIADFGLRTAPLEERGSTGSV